MKTFSASIKRFYIPGLVFNGKCKKCNSPVTLDMSEHYITEPEFGPESKNEEYYYCDKCDENTPLVIRLELEAKIL